MLPIERHNVFQTRHVSKESPEYIASRWMLSCFSELLCVSIAIHVTKFCTRGGHMRKYTSDSYYSSLALVTIGSNTPGT
jgi:hypothetical protein